MSITKNANKLDLCLAISDHHGRMDAWSRGAVRIQNMVCDLPVEDYRHQSGVNGKGVRTLIIALWQEKFHGHR